MTTTPLSYKEFKEDLERFIGSEKYYRAGFSPIVVTDGIKYFADKCECYWLLDEICLGLFRLHQQLGYLFIDIEVNKRHTVHVTVRQDRDEPIVFNKKIKDLCGIIPVGTYQFYLMNNVLLLPSEY